MIKGGFKSSLDYAVSIAPAETRGKTSGPLLRKIGFTEISFIVLAGAGEFHERTRVSYVQKIVSMTRN